MKTREFLTQAFFLTSHFDRLVAARCRPPETALQRFWIASRSRFDQWGLALRRCTDQLDQTDYAVDGLWRRWSPLLEEILISEIVTRVWTYLLEALDDRWGFHEYGPVGQSAYRAHIDARRRVLNLLLRGRQRALPAVWRLNFQRLSAERWTDLLFSQVEPHAWLDVYAFDEQRVQRFRGVACQRADALAILGAAGQAAFAQCADVTPDHVDVHQRMHAAMLACFGHELFHGTGQPISRWQARLMALTDDTHGLLREWLNDSAGHADRDCRGTTPRDR